MFGEMATIKGEMTLLSFLQLLSTDLKQLQQQLQQKRDSMPQLFENSPLAVDCSSLGDACEQLDMVELRRLIAGLGFIPVGIRHVPEHCIEQDISAGWPFLRIGRTAHQASARHERPTLSSSESHTPLKRVEVIERPVRSGQQVFFPDGDIVVLQHTSAGSELLAGGSVHVYGSLRGRVLAGIRGDTSARIFCQKLEAELVAIAGNYRLLDDIDTTLKGQPAMVWLEGEKLKIAPMF